MYSLFHHLKSVYQLIRDQKLADNAFSFDEMVPKNTEAIHENADLQTISAKSTDSESDSSEIIEYSPYFGPYKSILERVVSEEINNSKSKEKGFSSNTVEVG